MNHRQIFLGDYSELRPPPPGLGGEYRGGCEGGKGAWGEGACW